MQMPLVPSDQDTVLYLCIFSRVLEAVQTLHDNHIAHFDIKCDNILIRENSGDHAARSKISTGPGHSFNFSVCIGDFGEAQIQQSRMDADAAEEEDDDDEGRGGKRKVLQARGTEAVQSPEMLQIVARNRPDAVNYDRRKTVTVGCSSDVWSLG
jgi:serine/threonine protein kinase